MNPRQILRYALIAIGWLCIAFAHGVGKAWPAQPGADLNQFMGWHSSLDTPHLLRFVFNLPAQTINDLRTGVDIPLLHIAYLALLTLTLLLTFFSPLLVARVRAPRTLLVFRALAILMLLPLALTALPADLHLPQPHVGYWLLLVAFVCCAIALFIPPLPAPKIVRERKPD